MPGKGIAGIARKIDYEDLSLYTEGAVNNFSVFMQYFYREIDPSPAPINTAPQNARAVRRAFGRVARFATLRVASGCGAHSGNVDVNSLTNLWIKSSTGVPGWAEGAADLGARRNPPCGWRLRDSTVGQAVQGC